MSYIVARCWPTK